MTGSPGDPVGALLVLMADLEPALSPEAVLGALEQAAARPDGRRRIAAAVTGQPGLLTGQGARAPFPGVLRFIGALARAGAAAVVEPPCPRCGRQRQLGVPVEGLRLCAGCRSKARALPCGRCGKVQARRPASTTAGSPSARTAGTGTRGAGNPAQGAGTAGASPRSPKPGLSARPAVRVPVFPAASAGRPMAAGSASRGQPAPRYANGAASAGSPAHAAGQGRR